MRKYLKQSPHISDFYNIPEDIIKRKHLIRGDELYEIWSEYTQLDSGLLDFEFEHQFNQVYQYNTFDDEIISQKKLHFRYVSGKIEIISISGFSSMQDFINLVNDEILEVLCIRIPDFKSIVKVKDVEDDFAISHNENELMDHHITRKIYALVYKTADGNDKAPKTYVQYVALVNKFVKAHFIKLYSKIKVNKYTLAYLKSEGWNLMRLDRLDELVELFLLDVNVMRQDHIYFYKGTECLSVPNRTVVKEKDMLLSGNLGKDSYI